MTVFIFSGRTRNISYTNVKRKCARSSFRFCTIKLKIYIFTSTRFLTVKRRFGEFLNEGQIRVVIVGCFKVRIVPKIFSVFFYPGRKNYRYFGRRPNAPRVRKPNTKTKGFGENPETRARVYVLCTALWPVVGRFSCA